MSILHTLFPKGRAEALRLLFQAPYREMHLRELARQSGLSIRAVQKEIAILGSIDLITIRKDGNRSYIRANPEHPAYPQLSAFIHKVDGLSEALEKAFEGVEEVEIAFIFGSVAKGEEKAASDVDLMVIGRIGLRALVPILRPIGLRFGREINPHLLTSEEWKEKYNNGDIFVYKVAHEAQIFLKGNANELKAMGHEQLAKAT